MGIKKNALIFSSLCIYYFLLSIKQVPFPKIEYTIPSRPLGHAPVPTQLPDAPWNPDDQAFNELDISDDEVTLYFHDSEKQKKLKNERRAKKLKKMKEEFSLRSISLPSNASFETWIPEEQDGILNFRLI